VHPATADRDGERGRRADLEFLVSPLARRLVADEGVVLIDYRPVQEAWNRVIP
jgi:rhodanese-related sulfurtransferase